MSWINYEETSLYPIQNIPFGVYTKTDAAAGKCATRIGDVVVDLSVLYDAGLIEGPETNVFNTNVLNDFMALGRPVWKATRESIIALFTKGSEFESNKDVQAAALIPAGDAKMLLPARVGDYTDFYSSKEHATNLGTMFRPNEAPLKPNWVWLPVGYHGRASSVVVSGTPIRRPNGQTKARDASEPTFKACARMDLELEMGFFVGPGNELGDPVSIENAEDHIFGITIMNDWSARDIQAWEYVPLGPFNGKNLGTTISPWVITLEALEPFRVASPEKDVPTLSYLTDESDAGYDMHLEIMLNNDKLDAPHKLSESNLKYLYWSMKQQLVHHTVTGCNLRPGDLMGSGTISGPETMYGSLIEASANGKRQIELPNGEKRSFLEDGDSIVLTGVSQGEGFRIGFDTCEGTILPAHAI